MGKGSRRRRQLLKQQHDQHDQQPVTGDMAQRMTALSRQDQGKQDKLVSHPSPKLPMHYGGGRSYSSHMSWERQVYGDRGKMPEGSYFNGREWIFPGNEGINQQVSSRATERKTIEDAGYRPIHQESDTFRCDSDDITDPCPIAKVPEIDIPAVLWKELLNLAKDFDTEWLAYMIGSYDEAKRKYTFTKVYFPPQTATGAHVDVDTDFEPHAGTIGAIHSHVGMDVFFSAEDIAHSNWQVEIVINRAEKLKALVRHKLDCGKYAKSYSKVWLTGIVSNNAYKQALDKAFDRGEKQRTERWNRDRGYKPLGTGAGQTQPTVTVNTNSSPSQKIEWCQCRHPRTDHADDGRGLCQDTDCSCQYFRLHMVQYPRELSSSSQPSSQPSSASPQPSPSKESLPEVRMDMESGRILDQVSGEVSEHEETLENDLAADLAKDAATPVCQKCDGKGWLTVTVNGITTGNVCDLCQGMGDSRDGMVS